MNVYLLKDSKVSENIYDEVIELLKGFNNPLHFIDSDKVFILDDLDLELDRLNEGKFNKRDDYVDRSVCFSLGPGQIDFPLEREVAGPEDILKSCYDFRKRYDISDNHFVILLTEQANNLNWFSFGDTSNNAFIHTSDWGYYLGCNSAYPITYEVIANIYYMILFDNMNDAIIHTHKDAKGCINDFCEQKKDIKLKMRTADICSSCQDLMMNRNFPMSIFTQITEIMEFLRKKLISLDRFVNMIGASNVEFRGYSRKMILTDLDNLEIKFTPLEKTVYHLFLNHPEGIRANCIKDLERELRDLYRIFFNGNNLAKFENSISNLCDYLNPSMQEKVSSIKRKIVDAVGSSLASYYIIEKDMNDDLYKIKLDRSKITLT